MWAFIESFKSGWVRYRRAGKTGPMIEGDTGPLSFDPPLREKGSEHSDEPVSFSKVTRQRGKKRGNE